jgi:hypothetical protein
MQANTFGGTKMRELVVRHDRELRRLARAIIAFEAKPCADRLRMQHLRSALIAERDAIQQSALSTGTDADPYRAANGDRAGGGE